jgi:HPt (histidine-containing phosphotransfer) domain-containing protein
MARQPELLDEAVIADLEETLDGDVLAELLDLYFAQTAGHVAALTSAIDHGESVAASQMAHTLKGGSGALGAAHVAGIAGAIEETARAGDMTGAGELLDRLASGLDATRTAFSGRMSGHPERE